MTYRISLQPGGQAFEAEAEQSVLDAALAAGFILPYSCRDGACGACKGKVLSGDITYLRPPGSSLSESDRAEGLALFCCASARSDLKLEARSVSRVGDIPIRKLPTRVNRLQRLAEDVMLLELKLPASERFNFRPGQFIDILLADGSRRSFSIANTPGHSTIELHIRRIDGGRFTNQVFSSMKLKDILRIEGPLGSFFLREDANAPLILLAGGTGFAPLKSIIEHAIEQGVRRPIQLYWGARERAGLYHDEMARAWQDQLPGLRYIPVLSEAHSSDAWTGREGLVHAAVIEDFASLADHQVYACGSPAMIDAARAAFCGERSLPEEAFFADAFTFAAPTA